MVNKGHLPQVILWLGTLSSLLSSGMPQLEHDFFFFFYNKFTTQHNFPVVVRLSHSPLKYNFTNNLFLTF